MGAPARRAYCRIKMYLSITIKRTSRSFVVNFQPFSLKNKPLFAHESNNGFANMLRPLKIEGGSRNNLPLV